MNSPILQVVMRCLHVVSAILAVGGLGFYLFCLTPAVRLLDDGFSESWLRLIRQRFGRLLWACIAGLTVSGLYNWVLSGSTYKEMGAFANALIGIKVLLALVLFAVVWVGSVGLLKPRVCQMINIHLAAVVILLAVILRYLRIEHLQSLAGGG